MIKKQHRHGDVALLPVEVAAAEPEVKGRIVLALGETTGHAHVITGDVVMWSVAGQRYLQVGPAKATLTHEEHGLQTVEPGTYQVVQQREWSLADEWHAVAD